MYPSLFRPFPASVTISRLQKAAEVIESFDLGGRIFVYCSRYEHFIVMDMLGKEVVRNIALAIVAVFVCTEMVLCDILGCIIVSVTVLIGFVNVCGYMYFIGMHLETVSVLFITVAQGITVDYSAHIVHSFLKAEGTSREDRLKQSMVSIGPAVFNGAVSTFSGFCFCVFGTSPITFTFFKIFSLIIFSGLFGAFIVLPIILSLFGPGCNVNYQVDLVEEFRNGENTKELQTGIDNRSFDRDGIEIRHRAPHNSDDVKDSRNTEKSTKCTSNSIIKALKHSLDIADESSPSNGESVETSFQNIPVKSRATRFTHKDDEMPSFICPPNVVQYNPSDNY